MGVWAGSELWVVNGEEPPSVLEPHLSRLDVRVLNLDEVRANVHS